MKEETMDIKRVFVIVGLIVAVILSFVFILNSPSQAVTESLINKETSGGILEKEIKSRENLLSVVLIGATDYEIAELFNDILENAPGVVKAKRYRFILDPKKPPACRIEWQVQIENTSPFQLESHVSKAIRSLSVMDGKTETLKLSFLPTAEQKKLIANIRPWQATAKQIRFHFLHLSPENVNETFVHRDVSNHWPDTGFE